MDEGEEGEEGPLSPRSQRRHDVRREEEACAAVRIQAAHRGRVSRSNR